MKNQKLEVKFRLIFIWFWIRSVFVERNALINYKKLGYESLADAWKYDVVDTYENHVVVWKLNQTPTIMSSTTRQLGCIIAEQMSMIDDWLQNTYELDFPMRNQVIDSLVSTYNMLDLFRLNIQRNPRMVITPEQRNNIRISCKDAMKNFAAYAMKHIQH